MLLGVSERETSVLCIAVSLKHFTLTVDKSVHLTANAHDSDRQTTNVTSNLTAIFNIGT